MKQLTFEVQDQTLTRTDKLKIIGDTIGQFEALFVFNDWWDGYTATAQFSKNGLTYDALIVDGVCAVPDEAIAGNGNMYVNVFSADGDGNRKTVNEVAICVYASGLKTASATHAGPVITIWNVVLAFLNKFSGGTAGQFLRKKSAADYDVEWVGIEPSGGATRHDWVLTDIEGYESKTGDSIIRADISSSGSAFGVVVNIGVTLYTDDDGSLVPVFLNPPIQYESIGDSLFPDGYLKEIRLMMELEDEGEVYQFALSAKDFLDTDTDPRFTHLGRAEISKTFIGLEHGEAISLQNDYVSYNTYIKKAILIYDRPQKGDDIIAELEVE